jgi:hypothetical protein
MAAIDREPVAGFELHEAPSGLIAAFGSSYKETHRLMGLNCYSPTKPARDWGMATKPGKPSTRFSQARTFG